MEGAILNSSTSGCEGSGPGVTDLSVVIVTWNSGRYLGDCVACLAEATRGLSMETIVVDNASEDGSGRSARDLGARVLESSRNVGFAAAANRGWREAQGRAVCFLNPDVRASAGSLSRLVKGLAEESAVGVVGPRIMNPDGTLQLACRRSLPTREVALWRLAGLSRMFPGSGRFARYNLTFLPEELPCEVDAVSGSCFVIRREVLERLGGFDERFFLYGEDLDLFWRAREAGWKVIYEPAGLVIHDKGHAARGRFWRKTRYEFHRSMWLFYLKHLSAKRLWVDVLVWGGIWGRYALERVLHPAPVR